MRNFNTIPFPSSLIRASAEDAAFAALRAFQDARAALARPVRSTPVTAIHAEVLRMQRVAESLARRAS